MSLSPRFLAVSLCTAGFGLALTFGCEPRKKANTAGTGTVAAATTTAAPTATTTAAPTATAVPTAAPTPTGTVAPTATGAPTAVPPATGGWPTPMPTLDPNLVAEWAKKAQEMGLPIPGAPVPGTPAAPAGDPVEANLKASGAKNAPGFTAASPIGRATLKQGEHAGMNFNMQKGKCYVVLGAAGPGVTQLGLHLLFPATPPNAAIASDTSNTTSPVLGGGGKPLCPPVDSAVRVDTVITSGAGNVGVQVWVK